ncbi:MAG: RNA pseudouridine synthase [Treponema sp.]|jgi:23S rRNA pseudouridine1911/1915/1917 synthase|nr:RNA pseudouridine synthase [Treponema sp.]
MNENERPYILDETNDFAVVYKPPRMHCASHKNNTAPALLDWYAAVFPPVLDISGRKTGEGGLIHRLDFETQGLTLFAKNQQTFEFFLALQEAGSFIKEYSALCRKAAFSLAGFPPAPDLPSILPDLSAEPFSINSFFRPYGPGRKAVRPILEPLKGREIAADQGGCYRTEIIGIEENIFTLRLRRGFRHQIRCHLAWIGRPIVNDPLYGPEAANPKDTPYDSGFLALRSHGLFFIDPSTNEPREYRIAPLGK